MVEVTQTVDDTKQVTAAEEEKIKEECGPSCPLMARFGVCLYPTKCDLKHIVPQVKTTEKMSLEAKEFNPFTAQIKKAASKEFNPEVIYAPVSPVQVVEKENIRVE